jgi:hypothetical protein
VDVLDRQSHVRVFGIFRIVDLRRAVGVALHEMHARYGRQLLQIGHGEAQRTFHQPVDGKAVLIGIEQRKFRGVLLHEVHRRRRDDPHIVLKRREMGQMIEAVSRPAAAAARWTCLAAAWPAPA